MIRRRGHLYWEIRLDLKRKPGEVRKQVFHHFRGTRQQAVEKEAELRAAISGRRYVPRADVTLGEYLPAWIEAHRANLAATTAARYDELIIKHVVPRLGGHRLDELTRATIKQAWKDARVSGRLKPRDDGARLGLSPATIRQMHAILHRALEDAVEDKVLAFNPAHGVALPTARRPDLRVLTMEEAAILLDAIRHTAMYMPAVLALHCGLRRGEVCALRWRDVDLDGATLHVARSLDQIKDKLTFKQPKGGKGRAIALPALTVEELRRHRAKQAALRLQLGLGRDDDALVISQAGGEPVRPRTMTHEFTRLARRVKGIPMVSFHSLRHSNVTHQLALGVPVKVVQERLGHSTASFTLDRYGHVLSDMQTDAASRLDAALRQVTKNGG